MEKKDKEKGPALEPDIDPNLLQEWREIQEALRLKIITTDPETQGQGWMKDPEFKGLSFMCGLDISYPKEPSSKEAFAAIVICQFPSLEKVYERVVYEASLQVPYVPGFLAFRELPSLLSLLEEVTATRPEIKPDLILVDGNGLLHPQRAGIACHIGHKTGIPTVGVAKNLFLLEDLEENCTKREVQGMARAGDFAEIRDKKGEVLGLALKSVEEAKNPIYVSVGNKISLQTARRVVLACCKHRVPDPIRFADQISREAIRQRQRL